jgi:hypothetical protein
MAFHVDTLYVKTVSGGMETREISGHSKFVSASFAAQRRQVSA